MNCLPCFDSYWQGAGEAGRRLKPPSSALRMDRSSGPAGCHKPARLAAAPAPQPSGSAKPQRRALLIGINYFATDGELKGCINDVLKMRAYLSQHGFAPLADDMRCLTDDARQPHLLPTRANILAGMQWLVSGAAPGDVLFFHFSGHGGQQVDTHGDEEDGMDETICPVDFVHAGQICDDELFARLVAPLPAGCRLTCLLDCCHSGHGMDFPYTLHDEGGLVAWNRDTHFQNAAAADVVLFSGCEDDQCSADASCRYGHPAGAMTTAFLEVMRPGHTYLSLLRELQAALAARGFEQQPQISSVLPFALTRAVALDDATTASAPSGPIVALPRPPCARREYGGGFGSMLGSSDATGFWVATMAMQAAMHHRYDAGGAPPPSAHASRAEGSVFAADTGKPAPQGRDDEEEDEEDDEEEDDDDYEEEDYDEEDYDEDYDDY